MAGELVLRLGCVLGEEWGADAWEEDDGVRDSNQMTEGCCVSLFSLTVVAGKAA